MSRYAVRRGLALAALSSSAVLGLLAPAVAQASPATPSATPSAAQTPAAGSDVRDRVLRSQPGGIATVITPDRSASGAPVRQVPRIGKAAATPIEQTWRTESSRAARGAVSLVHTPSLNTGRRLCLDVQGDSTAEGAPLVLRPCDGTDSQAWRQLTAVPPTKLENVGSALKMEIVGARVVQAQFPARDDADAQQRNTAQSFFISPKSFGVGGA